MKIEQHWLRWIGFGGIFLGIGLIVVRAQSLGDAILDLQFRIPQDPVALLGNILAIASALFLILVKPKGR
jgi:drug/metabolite transporter (DMT)-like permease